MKLDGMPTEQVVDLAPAIEAQGLDQIWVCEDLGRNGGIAQAALALAATERCEVGLGILPAAVRNVGYLAMEIASLCRTYPDRFLPGLGHGEPYWLRQVGAHPQSLLACLAEVTDVARRLLEGETVTFDGRHVHIEDVALEFPPLAPPPFFWGVRGPKGIELASKVADGLILAEGSGPTYVAGARERLDPAATVIVFAWFSIDSDGRKAADRLRATVADALTKDSMQSQVRELGATGPTDEVVNELTISGDAQECADAIMRLYAAGADSVVLQPPYGSEREQLQQIGPLMAALGRS
jgi:alkanesulfonate monooxygenase SsuD/methylene tetrahydromethanopterin reductase-like flavin-dependent oxidoreductase (luciferase family)